MVRYYFDKDTPYELVNFEVNTFAAKYIKGRSCYLASHVHQRFNPDLVSHSPLDIFHYNVVRISQMIPEHFTHQLWYLQIIFSDKPISWSSVNMRVPCVYIDDTQSPDSKMFM
jgi:hypothetical protein